MKTLILVLFLMAQPVINPDNVRPGEWFIPGPSAAQQEADRQQVCAIREARTGLRCD